MILKHRTKFKTFLVIIILAKLGVTAAYFSGMSPSADFLWIRESSASEGEKASEKKTEEKKAGDKKTTEKSVAVPVPSAEEQKEKALTEVKAVMDQLDAREALVKQEEERINAEKAQLEQLKQEIDSKLEQLSAVQAKIDEGLAKKTQLVTQEQQQQDSAEAAKAKQLSKVYTSMAPKKAAEIIEKMDLGVVYQIFSSMKGEEVGQIMTYVSGDRAAKILEHMAGIGTTEKKDTAK